MVPPNENVEGDVLPSAPTELMDPAELELSPDAMRAMADEVLDRVIDHVASLGGQPAVGDMANAEAQSRELEHPIPEHGMDLADTLGPLFDEWIPGTFNSAGPGYLGFVPGGGLFPSALADLIADATNRYTGVWNASPCLVQLEANVLDAFRSWMGMPATTRGLLTTGGSMATFSAVVSARQRLLGEHLRDGVLYTSSQAHHCVAKAAHLAGILRDRHRIIDVDDRMRMRVDALAAAIDEDCRAGLKPFLVVSAAGTTNTGAVDPLEAIGEICRDRGLWHHCDAAYGGFFHLVDELRPTLAGMSDADSITLDPHKGLFLPYGTGAVLVRDGEALREAHGAHASYLPPQVDDRYDPAQYGPELSRPFRGLRVWLPLMVFGLARIREALREKHELARWCADQLLEDSRFSLVEPPPLSLFAFRFFPHEHATERDVDTATRTLLEHVNTERKVFLTGATTSGRFYGRVCVLCFRTRHEHVAEAVDAIRRHAG